jgi:alanine dehydrogenase
MLRVGVLKEIKKNEGRVALCPEGVLSLTSQGIEVAVESGAGDGCSCPDEMFVEAGATIFPSAEKLLKNAELIVKVLPVSPVEAELITDAHMVFSFLKLNPTGDRLKPLINSNTVYFGADLLEDDQGAHPVLEAISEVDGRMAVHVAANLLSVSQGGKGILLSGADVIAPANVTIIGSGLIGRVSAVQAWTNGANVSMLSLKPENIESYDIIRDGLMIQEFTPEKLKELLPKTDILIVSVYSLRNPVMDFIINKELINLLTPGSVVIDLSVEQNPVIETSHVTDINQPTYIVNNIVHYCVPNISATVPLTSSKIYTKKITPYIELLAKNSLKNALTKSPELLSALAIYKGKITNRILADRFGHTFNNIFDLLELNL